MIPFRDDDDNGFGATVRYAPGVTKVRYRKKNLIKKSPKIDLPSESTWQSYGLRAMTPKAKLHR